jgi:hypothetical protein
LVWKGIRPGWSDAELTGLAYRLPSTLTVRRQGALFHPLGGGAGDRTGAAVERALAHARDAQDRQFLNSLPALLRGDRQLADLGLRCSLGAGRWAPYAEVRFGSDSE